MENKNILISLGLLAGLVMFCGLCAMCGVMGRLLPGTTTTQRAVLKETATQTLIVAMAKYSTALSTSKPTNTSISELQFADIIQNPNQKRWTDTQYSYYFDTIKGKLVNGWSGTILEIKEYGGEPYLSLDMEPGGPKIDAYVYINKDDVLKVGLGQKVTFTGTIDSNWVEPNGWYSLQIKGVKLLTLSEIPTPTPVPPTSTPGPPTPTPGPPTPYIGNKIMAEVMCKDFVRDHLKSPSTANFGGFLDDWDTAAFLDAKDASKYGVDTSKLHNSGMWVVIGQVDAQNSFGAMIRSKYTCVMDYDNSTATWYLLDISIE